MSATSISQLLPRKSAPRGRTNIIRTCVFALADVLAFALARLVVPVDGNTNMQAYGVVATAWLVWLGLIQFSYTRHKPFWMELQRIYMGLLVMCVLGVAFKALAQASQGWLMWVVLCLVLAVLLPLARRLARQLLQVLQLWQKPTLIFGTGENAKEACLALHSEPALGFRVQGFMCLKNCSQPPATPVPGLPVVNWSGRDEDYLLLKHFHCVVAVEAEEKDLRDTLIRQLTQHQVKDVHVIPAMRGVPLYGLDTSHFFSHEVLMIQVRNNLANPVFRVLKRGFDVLGSTVLLCLLSPLFAFVAYKVSRDGGKAFFGHTRVGQDSVPFQCYKFRSMVVNAQEVLQNLLATDPVAKAEWDKDFKLKNDPRINALGHFLRKTSLDELPQLWNVLKGEMSLVGPRPVVQAELDRYGQDVAYYLMGKPGMTGLWQVSGRNDVDYETRVYLDAWYVKNWSLWTDIAILFKTIGVVTGRSGAY